MTDTIDKARNFAISAHWGQMYGSKPYYFHLDRVAEIAKDYGLPMEIQIAAYLHDVVEDTEVTANEVFELFGYEIATLVYSVTDEDSSFDYKALIQKISDDQHLPKEHPMVIKRVKSIIRNDKKKKTYPKIISHPFGVFLKLCDRIANVECSLTSKDTGMIEKYRSEQVEFKEKLFTPGVAGNLWHDLEALMKGN